jgi:hypothetical protein
MALKTWKKPILGIQIMQSIVSSQNNSSIGLWKTKGKNDFEDVEEE